MFNVRRTGKIPCSSFLNSDSKPILPTVCSVEFL